MKKLKKCFLCGGENFSIKADEKNNYFIECVCGINLKATSRIELIMKWNNRKNMNDGYHSFNDLYLHRYALLACFSKNFKSFKSLKHHNEDELPMFEDSFIVQIQLPNIGQISYHLPLVFFNDFPAIEIPKGLLWDGHTSEDVVKRLLKYCNFNSGVISEI